MKIFDFLFSKNRKSQSSVLDVNNVIESDNINFRHKLLIPEYTVDGNPSNLSFYTNEIDHFNNKSLDKILKGLDELNNNIKVSFLEDFNNEDYLEYISGLYSRLLSEDDFNNLKRNSTDEQILLSAFKHISTSIYYKKDETTIKIIYMYGYEMNLTFEADGNFKLIGVKLEEGSIILSGDEKFSNFLSRFEDDDIAQICSRFDKSWWNQPIKSFYLYEMTEKVKLFLSNKI